MSTAANDFLSRLRAIFRLEADEHLRSMTIGLLALEKAKTAEERQPLWERVFREVHSLKGAAQAVDLMEVEMICQSVESIFAQLKRGTLPLAAEGFDAMHAALNTVGALLNTPHEAHATQVSDALQHLTSIERQTPQGEETPTASLQLTPLRIEEPPSPAQSSSKQVMKLASLVHLPPRREQASPLKPASKETIRVSTQKLDALLLQAEEMLTVKLSTPQRANDLQKIGTLVVDWKKEWTKSVAEVGKLQQALKDQATTVILNTSCAQIAPTLVEFLSWNERQLNTLETQVHELVKVSASDQRLIGTLIDNLVEETRRVLGVPFSSLLEIFPKMVRDLSRSLGKKVELLMQGSEVEIDKRILKELKIPLLHLLRNSLDHGIETPAARVRQGKLPWGSLQISISRTEGRSVEILVSDNGAGIDAAAVKQAAVNKGLLTAQAAEALDEQAVINLIFCSTVTTSPLVTGISGRGLGLAIAREKVENLGGHLSVETHLHRGTTFRIALPLPRGACAYQERKSDTGDTATVTTSMLSAADSLASHILLRGILESAGYQAITAVEGGDPFPVFQKTNGDLFVSAVEMAGIKGFDQTTKSAAPLEPPSLSA